MASAKLSDAQFFASLDAITGGDGVQLLDDVAAYLARFVAYPSVHAHCAHTLWVAHTHLMGCWESTPRIAFLSPEPGSGKSRALEATEPLVPNPIHAVNTTPAYLFRKVADPAGPPTLLYDEIDTVFGPSSAKNNEDIRGMLNAGHRRGAVAGRCVVRGKTVETEELPAYCAVALAGLNDLPDTIMSRAVVVRMRRRLETEPVDDWRHRVNSPEGETLRDRLTTWAKVVGDDLADAWPDMPDGVTDRDADMWEPLLSVADAAGGGWPERARAAALVLVAESRNRAPSLGVLLLKDIRTVFADEEKLATVDLVKRLVDLDESPWGNLRGKPIDARSLARRLSKYDIRPGPIDLEPAPGMQTRKQVRGYERAWFTDAWGRYLPPLPDTDDS